MTAEQERDDDHDCGQTAADNLDRAIVAEARLAKVQEAIDALEANGCFSCMSGTGGDLIAAELREALGGEQ